MSSYSTFPVTIYVRSVTKVNNRLLLRNTAYSTNLLVNTSSTLFPPVAKQII